MSGVPLTFNIAGVVGRLASRVPAMLQAVLAPPTKVAVAAALGVVAAALDEWEVHAVQQGAGEMQRRCSWATRRWRTWRSNACRPNWRMSVGSYVVICGVRSKGLTQSHQRCRRKWSSCWRPSASPSCMPPPRPRPSAPSWPRLVWWMPSHRTTPTRSCSGAGRCTEDCFPMTTWSSATPWPTWNLGWAWHRPTSSFLPCCWDATIPSGCTASAS
mmetsp:Transcript_66484/g.187905  ORF Transcript_66484/g.187905 Transcript_66484/m.187905 type:complete len:215 (-) Transcript_66484:111-755(-)